VNIVTRRVGTDNNVLLQVIRSESSFHGLRLLVFRLELIKNVLEFRFQNLKSSNGNSFEILHFAVNSEMWAGVYKTFRLFKVGNVCIVFATVAWARVRRSATVAASVQLCFASCA